MTVSRLRNGIVLRLMLVIVVCALVCAAACAAVIPAHAFPGDKRDEECPALIAAATQNGTPVPEDCLSDPGMSAIELRAAEASMQEQALPPVVRVPYQETIVWERSYRKLISPATIYDAPNGNPVREWEKGYNYVTVLTAQDGWIQINWTEWVQADKITWADVSEFSGVEITEQIARPFAWMLAEARPSRYPGGEPYADYDIIDRYTLLSIFGVEYVDGWEWYLVGPNQWVQQIRVAKVQPISRPAEIGSQERWIAVDLYEQTAVAYEGDRMVFATLISSGLPRWDTNEGLFRIYDRWEATKMSGAEGQIDFYFIEEVPYVMYFDEGISLHGTYWHDRFGYRQSHGCVNLSIMDSWWLFQWTNDEAYHNAWVYVYSSGEYRSDLPNWAVR